MESLLITEFEKLRRRREKFFGFKISTMLISRIFKAEKVKILNFNKFGFNSRPFILTSTIIDGKTAQFHQKQRKKHRELMKNSAKFAQK